MFNLRMKNDLPFFIGYRYLRRSRDEKFISFISALSIAAMALGVSTLVIVLSIMNGFDREIKNRLLQIIPHISADMLDLTLVIWQLTSDPHNTYFKLKAELFI